MYYWSLTDQTSCVAITCYLHHLLIPFPTYNILIFSFRDRVLFFKWLKGIFRVRLRVETRLNRESLVYEPNIFQQKWKTLKEYDVFCSPVSPLLWKFQYQVCHIENVCYFLLQYRESDPTYVRDINLRGLGLGNAFVSPRDQSVYADYVNGLSYLTKAEYDEMKTADNQLVEAIDAGDYIRGKITSK